MLQRIPSRTVPAACTLLPRFVGQDVFTPFEVLRRMADEPRQGRQWAPRVDIRETEEAFLIDVELPGLGKKDVEITVEKQVLTLSGERTPASEEGTYHCSERLSGKFSRSFTLPQNTDRSNVKARFQNGLLTLTVPKLEEAKPRSIVIQ